MATVSLPMANQRRSFVPALVKTGLLVGVSDAIFATALTFVPPLSTPLRVWQGVASVPFGRGMRASTWVPGFSQEHRGTFRFRRRNPRRSEFQ